MDAITKRWVVTAVLLLACTGCDKAKDWLDLGQAQQELPEKRDLADSIQPLQAGEWRFDPRPVRVGFAANWQTIKVSPTPVAKPSSGESDQASTSSSSSNQGDQNNQTDEQPEKSVAPSFVCAFNDDGNGVHKLFCGNLQPDVAMVRMVEARNLPQNLDPGQLKMSAGHVCVKTNDQKLSCGQLQQSADKPVIMQPVRQGGADKTDVVDWDLSDTHLCATVVGAGVAPEFIGVGNKLLACGALPDRLGQPVRIYQERVYDETGRIWVKKKWNDWFKLSGNAVCSTMTTNLAAPVEGNRLFCAKLADKGDMSPLMVQEKIKQSHWHQNLYQVNSRHICGRGNGRLACGRFPDKVGGELVMSISGVGAPNPAQGYHIGMGDQNVCVWAGGELFCGVWSGSSGGSLSFTNRVGVHLGDDPNQAVYVQGNHMLLGTRQSDAEFAALPLGLPAPAAAPVRDEWQHVALIEDGLTLKTASAQAPATGYWSPIVPAGSKYAYAIQVQDNSVGLLQAFDQESGKGFQTIGISDKWVHVNVDNGMKFEANADYFCGIQAEVAGSQIGGLYCTFHETYEPPQEE